SCQIWRVNSAVEVLPLVPVTAATMRGWRAKKRAALKAKRRRGVSSATSAMPGGSWVPAGASTATAPLAAASAMKPRPSALLPGRAAKRKPGSILRESAESPRISISLPVVKPPVASPLVVTPWPSMGPRKSSLSRIRDAYLRQQRVLRLRRILRDGRETEHRRHPLHDAAHHPGRDPAARG